MEISFVVSNTRDRLQAALQKLCENQGVLYYVWNRRAPREKCARDIVSAAMITRYRVASTLFLVSLFSRDSASPEHTRACLVHLRTVRVCYALSVGMCVSKTVACVGDEKQRQRNR